MANPEHLKILQRGPDAWNTWHRGHKHGVIDLSGAKLNDLRLGYEHGGYQPPRGAILSLTNLSNTDLRDVCLSGVNLCWSHLKNARLNGADLSYADLNNTDFTNADLTNANLIWADLHQVKLDGAILRGAVLSGAALSDAQLAKADLTNSKIGMTKFSNVDLSEVVGLDTVLHRSPSTIGVDTIYRSQGKRPDKFLLDAGVPEEIIDIARSIRNGPPIQWHSCFISYSHEDKAFARLLHDRLQGQGIRCWLDEHQLLPGDDIHDRIDQGIRLWDKVLLCASKASLTSWWVDGEINRAFQKEARIMEERGKKVLALIPLNLDGFLFSDGYQSGKKSEIKSRVAANFVGWEKDHALFDRELEKVVRALRTDEGGREKPPSQRL